MPEVSRFFGIIIRFYYRDHPPTHFHAFYGEHEAIIEIETGAIHEGQLPGTAYNLVNQWRAFTFKNFAKTGIARGSNSLLCQSRLSNKPSPNGMCGLVMITGSTGSN